MADYEGGRTAENAVQKRVVRGKEYAVMTKRYGRDKPDAKPERFLDSDQDRSSAPFSAEQNPHATEPVAPSPAQRMCDSRCIDGKCRPTPEETAPAPDSHHHACEGRGKRDARKPARAASDDTRRSACDPRSDPDNDSAVHSVDEARLPDGRRDGKRNAPDITVRLVGCGDSGASSTADSLVEAIGDLLLGEWMRERTPEVRKASLEPSRRGL